MKTVFSYVTAVLFIGLTITACKKEDPQQTPATNNNNTNNPPPSDSTTATIVFDATHTGTFILCDILDNILAVRTSASQDMCTAPKINYNVKNSGTWLKAKITDHPNLNPGDTVVIQMLQIGGSNGQAGVMNSYGTYNPIPANSPTQISTSICPSSFILIAP